MTVPKATVSLCVLLASAAAYAGPAEQFQDWGRVVSVTPRYQYSNEPRQECRRERVMMPTRERDRSGALIGGITGALIGSQVGKGNGKVAAAAVGAATGALIGDQVGNRGNEGWPIEERFVERCTAVDDWRSVLRGYEVTYEYLGRNYSTMLPYEPGDRLRLQVSVKPM